jgi:hypothetical protein
MAIEDDVRQAVSAAISAGSSAARAQGIALKSDFEKVLKTQLDDVVVQTAAIAGDVALGNIGPDQAKDDLQTQKNRIVPIILGVAELAVLAVQTIINAVITALQAAVNKAAGVALL